MNPREISPQEAMDVLVGFLRDVKHEKAFKLDADGCFQNDDGGYEREASPAPDMAREWCRELLREAEADGLSGCPLCCS